MIQIKLQSNRNKKQKLSTPILLKKVKFNRNVLRAKIQIITKSNREKKGTKEINSQISLIKIH